jgi:hypothetical protein
VSIRSAECSRTASDPSRATPTLGNCLTIVSSAASSKTHTRTVFQGDHVVLGPLTREEPRLPAHLARAEDLQGRALAVGGRARELHHPRMHHEQRRLPRACPDEGLAVPTVTGRARVATSACCSRVSPAKSGTNDTQGSPADT